VILIARKYVFNNNLAEGMSVMGKLSEKEIDEVERLCKKINCPDISSAEKRDAYEKLDKILVTIQ
jgi:hypothetical protein